MPVPRAEYRFPWVIRIGKAAQGLRSVKLVQRTLNKLFPSESAGVVPARQTTREVVEQIFQSLQRTNIAKNSVLVLVYLPAKGDAQDTSRNPWREAVQATAASAGIHFIDLVAALKKEPPEVADALFIPPAGHYNRRGNLWVAETMYQSLMEIPELRARLQ